MRLDLLERMVEANELAADMMKRQIELYTEQSARDIQRSEREATLFDLQAIQIKTDQAKHELRCITVLLDMAKQAQEKQ